VFCFFSNQYPFFLGHEIDFNLGKKSVFFTDAFRNSNLAAFSNFHILSPIFSYFELHIKISELECQQKTTLNKSLWGRMCTAELRGDGQILTFTFELLDAGCSLPVAKYWILVAGCLIINVSIEDSRPG